MKFKRCIFTLAAVGLAPFATMATAHAVDPVPSPQPTECYPYSLFGTIAAKCYTRAEYLQHTMEALNPASGSSALTSGSSDITSGTSILTGLPRLLGATGSSGSAGS
ncbi:hypothetical protein ACWELJ_21710 [Nocardia sp. NPDC004582]